MDCPKCSNELSETLFDPESWEVAADFDRPQKCPACGLIITKEMIRDSMKPSDCILVQNEELEEDEFCEDCCMNCFEDCIFAGGDDSMGLVQDEEGNWLDQEDLDPDEWERMQ